MDYLLIFRQGGDMRVDECCQPDPVDGPGNLEPWIALVDGLSQWSEDSSGVQATPFGWGHVQVPWRRLVFGTDFEQRIQVRQVLWRLPAVPGMGFQHNGGFEVGDVCPVTNDLGFAELSSHFHQQALVALRKLEFGEGVHLPDTLDGLCAETGLCVAAR